MRSVNIQVRLVMPNNVQDGILRDDVTIEVIEQIRNPLWDLVTRNLWAPLYVELKRVHEEC